MADGTLNGVISQNGTMRASISPEPTQVRARMTPQTQGMNGTLEMARQFVAPTFFDDLADVDISEPQDGQVPRYNSETGMWENSTTQDAVWGNIVGSLSDQTDLQSALDAKISSTEKGTNGGVATLDNTGRVPSSQLPSFVDDVIEGYYKEADGKFYEESTYEHEITPEGGKIYVSLDTNKEYRWSGSVYVEISESLALGETQGTAYEGSKGKANADNIAAIQGIIPSGATTSNKLATASDVAAKQDLLTFDNVPTQNSNNPVKSGGLYSQIGDLTELITTNKDNLVEAINEAAQSGGGGDTSNCYKTDDATETDLDDADYVPFYDTSATGKRKSLWSNIKSVLKDYFDTLYPSKSHIGMVIHSTTLDTEAKVKAIYGGTTWIQLSGYMLRGATSSVTANRNQNDGGADSVTVSSVASHNHTQNSHNHTQNSHAHSYGNRYLANEVKGSGTFTNLATGGGTGFDVNGNNSATTGTTATNNAQTATNIANGANYTVNTLPKYKNIYIWERTA